MKLKRVLFTGLIIGCCLFGINGVKAIYYNGGATSGGNSSSGSCGSSPSSWCLYNNKHHKTVRVVLYYYYPNHTRSGVIGNVYYFSSNPSGASGNLGISIDNMEGGFPNYDYSDFADYFRSLSDREEYDHSIRNLIQNKLGVNYDSLDLESTGACGSNTYGYRLVIEPAVTVIYNGSYYLKTVKELASEGPGELSNSQNLPEVSRYMGTTCSDVGISQVFYGGSIDPVPRNQTGYDMLADEHDGHGYNIIDPKIEAYKYCYEITNNGTPASCYNTDDVNIGNFSQSVVQKKVKVSVSCAQSDVDANGRRKTVYVGGQACTYSCKETARQVFPGKVSDRFKISPNSYLIWPTSDNTLSSKFVNNFPLYFEGTLTCVSSGGVCNNVSASQLYQFETNASVTYNDGSTSKSYTLNPTSSVNYSKNVSGNTITFDASVAYKLADNLNRYVDKDGNISNSSTANSKDIGYGNLSVSKNAIDGRKYALQITNTKLGNSKFGNSNGTFGSLVSSGRYSCDYKIKPASACECDDGRTINVDAQGKTAFIAKHKKDGYITKDYKTVCELRNDSAQYSLYRTKSWDKSITCEDAKEVLCESGGDNLILVDSNVSNPYECTPREYTCNNNSQKYITECVFTKMGEGKTEATAVNECNQLLCPAKQKVIYRVIDLSNPFPSYDGDSNVSTIPITLRKGMFNDNLRGRYPGLNWNNQTLVKKYILNNRSVDGDSVYKKTPLYSFTLTPATIRAIRSYNDTTKYDDYRLSCKTQNKACVSSFVHNKAYGLVSGTCDKTLNATNFYSCAQ